jgi:hypothetical protein
MSFTTTLSSVLGLPEEEVVGIKNTGDNITEKDAWWNSPNAVLLFCRCNREHEWSRECALRVFKAYRQFIELKVAGAMPTTGRRSHVEVLDTEHYTQDCLLLCDWNFIRYDPDD